MTTTLLNAIPQNLWDFGIKRTNVKGTPIVLVAHVTNGVAESRYSALRVPGAPTGYEVTAGKTLELTRCRSYATTAAAEWYTLSGTADAGDSQVAAPANEVPLDAPAVGDHNTLGAPLLGAPLEADCFMQIAAGLFPAVRGMTASSHVTVWFLGHED